MKRVFLLALLVTMGSLAAHGQTGVTCSEANPQAEQYRGDVKHRAEGNATGASIKVADLYTLPEVSPKIAKAAKHAPMAGSAEKRTFTLTAFLWQAKVEGNDCEIHLELNNSRTVSTSRRVIVEIPADPDFKSDYQTILGLMQERFPNRHVLGPTLNLNSSRRSISRSPVLDSSMAPTSQCPALTSQMAAMVQRQSRRSGSYIRLGASRS